MLGYVSNQFRKTQKVVMAIICKNENDVIADNIKFHAFMGVKHFVIMDNGSTDGTREILAELQTSLDVEIVIFDEPSEKFEKKKWIWRLLKHAQHNMGATHVIPNDADEFWFSKTQDITDQICVDDVNVTVQRANVLLSEEVLKQERYYLDEPYRVNYPLCYDRKAELGDSNLSMLFANIGPKVFVSPSGLISLNSGFHRAKHLLQYKKRLADDLFVYHYPIRNYAQFFKNVENRAKILKQYPNASMGDHYKRWVKHYFEGTLEQEFERMLIKEADLSGLLKVSAVVKDEKMLDFFRSHMDLGK